MTFLLLACSVVPVQAATGFRQMLLDASSDRALRVTIWYPTTANHPRIMVGDNVVLKGTTVIQDAPIASGKYPLVLLSHGYGGSWRNMNWLAVRLVEQGFIVAAPDHPGTTTADRRPDQAAQLWLRPKDVSRVIDLLLDKPAIAGQVDNARIAAVGHSLGGWTVMALAGAEFDLSLFRADCRHPVSAAPCDLMSEFGLLKPEAEHHFQHLTDKRIKAVVALDAGLTRGFTPGSLAKIAVPTLLIAAGTDIARLPARYESGYLASSLPADDTILMVLPDATHFSFMAQCKPDAEKILKADAPDDAIICRDGGQRSRALLHQVIAQHINGFLSRVLRYEEAARPEF